MATGLIALLDDVAAIAKVAAASLDDVMAQAGRAGVKAAGVVIDDAAVTPRYVVGFAAERELPIVAKIAMGSLKNKLLFLLPGALALGAFAPWAINPLLMVGGVYLCYEGAEKVLEAVVPHAAHAHEAKVSGATDPAALEAEKVSGAIRTDFILSAEIMALTLATVPEATLAMQAIVLAVVGIGITIGVYGAVGLIVKADDVGVAMAANRTAGVGPVIRGLGRGLVKGMPWFLKVLAIVGTAAMVWVGGGILVHGLAVYGVTAPEHLIHDLAEKAAHAMPSAAAAAAANWLVTAALSGVLGLVVGAVTIPVVGKVFAPVAKAVGGLFRKKAPDAR
jgi:predicted DNA repair protein MutK